MKVWVQFNYGVEIDVDEDCILNQLNDGASEDEIRDAVMQDIDIQIREDLPPIDARIEDVVKVVKDLLQQRQDDVDA